MAGALKSELVWVVTSVDQSGSKGTENGQPLARAAGLNQIESPRRKDSDARVLGFRLEVGKQWNATNNWLDHRSYPVPDLSASEKRNVTVVGYEKVLLRTDECDAFKLRYKCRFRSSGGGAGTTDLAHWYAPSARAVVKVNMRLAWQAGVWPESNCELVEFQLQP